MDPGIREALVTAGSCTAIVYLAFLTGWLFRDHLGVPRANLKGWWVVLVVLPPAFFGVLVVRASLPSWAQGAVIGALGAAALWAEPRFLRAVRQGQAAVVGRDADVGDH